MTGTVPLVADYFPFHRGEHWDAIRLTDAPMLARSRAARRWHRPRSGRQWTADGRVSLTYWCGQTGHSGGRALGLMYADRLPPGEDGCGTCEGRAVGAGFPSSVFPDAPVLFQPRGVAPPDVCPAKHFDPLDNRWRTGLCLWCGAIERIAGGYRGYNWTPPHLAAHTPLRLLAPCDNHGWLSMVRVGDEIVCECRTEEVPRTSPTTDPTDRPD